MTVLCKSNSSDCCTNCSAWRAQ